MTTNKNTPPLWIKIWLAENMRTTSRFSTIQFGAYMLIVRDYWMSGPPADDDVLLARITGLSVPEWRKIRPAVEQLFEVAGGQWINPQIDADLEVMYETVRKNRARTAKATGARWPKTVGNGIRNGQRNGIRNASADGHKDFKSQNQRPQAKKDSVSAPAATDSDGDHKPGNSLPGWEGYHVY